MTTVQNLPHTTLYYRQGGSDKVYQAAIEAAAQGFVVTFAYGRRGATLTTGSKTPKPVDLVAAQRIYDKLVSEKTAKGYTPGAQGTPYAPTMNAGRATGILPQLLNPIDEDQLPRLIADDRWWAQEKFDGKRMLIRKQAGEITGINRRGLVIGLSQAIIQSVRLIEAEKFILDGESVGEVFHAFDALELNGEDLRNKPYRQRMATTMDLVDPGKSDVLRYAPTATSERGKQSMLERLRADNAEGLVFKRHAAAYVPGRPASGGDQLKCKFYATASVFVAGVNEGRRSVALSVIDGDRCVRIGNVTIPPQETVPATGDIIEVRYLYAYPGGSLYQPVYLGFRDDLEDKDCGIGQLKFKTGDEDDGG